MRERPSQLRKGALDLVILSLLARSPAYGGEILDALGDRPGLEITAGTLYPLLNRLRTAGLVECDWQESRLGPPRKYYTLTDKGRSVHADLVRQWRELTGAITTLLKEEQ